MVDVTVRDYTREHDAVQIRKAQERAYSRAMDALLVRYDAGETLSQDEIDALTKHFVG